MRCAGVAPRLPWRATSIVAALGCALVRSFIPLMLEHLALLKERRLYGVIPVSCGQVEGDPFQAQEGRSLRDIAEAVGWSKSKVHRTVQGGMAADTPTDE